MIVYMEMLKKLFFSTNNRSIQPKLIGNLFGGWGFRIVQIKGLAPFQDQ